MMLRRRQDAWKLGAAAVLGFSLGGCGHDAPAPSPRPAAPLAARSEAPAGLRARVREGDAASLKALGEAFPAVEASALKAPSEAEAVELVGVMADLRGGYPRFKSGGKATILLVARRILDRFTAEGTPAGWVRMLPDAFDLFAAGLEDADPAVRVVALEQVGGLWGWGPGCTMTGAEETSVASWKESFYPLVMKRLKDPEVVSRAAAVACVGRLPIDAKAAPAVAGIRDADFTVRFQALAALASRPNVLSEEDILPLLHDPVPDLRGLAEKVLAARGLSPDLIGLGRMVTHERAELRASAIGLLLRRDDIDPVVWLLRLSEDADATVRLKAVEAFAGRITPEVHHRLREMAAADDSAEVRAAAAKLAPADTTAALPPLPGSPSLNPKAN